MTDANLRQAVLDALSGGKPTDKMRVLRTVMSRYNVSLERVDLVIGRLELEEKIEFMWAANVNKGKPRLRLL